MADLPERERVWAVKKIEETQAELKLTKEELKAVEGKIETELEKSQPRKELLASWERTAANLRQQWTSLDAELQGFQGLLAAVGMCVPCASSLAMVSMCVASPRPSK